ncbi:immune inhibitor A, partial [bacterium]|nr:immune inhibitor A [bacterium]
MDRVSSCCLKLGFILFVLVAGTALAVSDSERDNLKTKLAAEEPLSQFEIQQIIELHDAGTPVVNGWQLSQLKEYGRIGDRPASSRRSGSTLDEYQYSVTTYNWFDISALGTERLLSDDGAMILDLPFDFTFYEQTYNSMSLGSNGYLVLGGTNTGSNNWNEAIPTEWEPNNFIAMFWDDLDSDNGNDGHVYTYHDAANDRFVIQFDAVAHWNLPGNPETFQCFLYSNGNIVIQYNTVSDASSCTAGIENDDGSDGIQVCFNQEGIDCPTNGLAILINQPDGFPNPITNFNANLSGSDVVLTWTDPTTDTNDNPLTIDNVQVWLGQPGIGTLLATVAGGVQTYTHANAPDGNLMYYVRPFADPYLGPATSTSIIVGDPSYLEDFEVTAGLWTSDNLDGWQWGSPTTGPGSAHGGANCWGTVLDGIYANNACYNMTLIPELAVESAGATVEFWMWYSSEQSYDGCHFKVSIDSGVTWELVTPLDDYPQPSVFSNPCIGEEIPCWAGESDGWQYFVIPIGQYVGQTPQYRFTFGSDGSFQLPGFFFDDMTIWGLAEPVGGDISGTITLDGGTGNVENVVVRADGLGAPVANPAANGSYLLEDVLVGERYVWATLANYQTTGTTVTLTEAGLTNINITLIRNLPPAPPGFTASVNAETGLITASWNASTDPMVDQYYLLKRYEGDTEWITAETTTATNVTHQLTSPGVYQVAVAAVDV